MNWKPIIGRRANERASVLIALHEALPSKRWERLSEALSLDLRQRGFDAIGVGEGGPVTPGNIGFQIIMGSGPMTSLADPPPLVFRRHEEDGVGETITVDRNGMRHVVEAPKTIADVAERVGGAMSAYLNTAHDLVSVQFVTLEVWGRFKGEAATGGADLYEVLNQKSTHLPAFVPHRNDLWHCHVGYFLPQPNGLRRLVNLNVDITDLPTTAPTGGSGEPPISLMAKACGVYEMVRAEFRPDEPAMDGDLLLSTLSDLNATSTDVLKDVLTADAVSAMAL